MTTVGLAQLPMRIRLSPGTEIVVIASDEYERLLNIERQLVDIRQRIVGPATDDVSDEKAQRSSMGADCAMTRSGKQRLNGLAMRAARKRAGLTLSQLGKLIGVSEPTVSKMEKGNRKSIDFVHAIAEQLAVDPESLLEPDTISGSSGCLE